MPTKTKQPTSSPTTYESDSTRKNDNCSIPTASQLFVKKPTEQVRRTTKNLDFSILETQLKRRVSKMAENLSTKMNTQDMKPTSGALTLKEPQTLNAEIVALHSSITAIARASGTPGISLGILHQNGELQYMNFGMRNGEESLKTSKHTIYHIASTGKFITALAIANLVHDGYLDWDEPLQKYLPADCWDHPDDEVREEVTISHCLTHTTGLAAQNRLWLAERGTMNFSSDETFKCFGGLEKLAPVGEKWLYNNWGYAVAGKLIKVLTGFSWAEYLDQALFQPLGMHDTVTDAKCSYPHVAIGYMTESDGTPVRNGRPHAGADAVQAGASGIQSSVHDLLLLYSSLFKKDTTLSEMKPLLGGQVDLEIRETINGNEQSYGMGWVRTQLPGVPSMNPRDTLVIGRATATEKGAAGPILLHHNGNYPGYTSAAFLLPETKTAVVVLTNSVGKIEAAELIGQMIVETILNHGKKNVPQIDWVGNALRDAAAYNQGWLDLASTLKEERMIDTTHLPLEKYTGRYYNNVGNWYMEIFLGPAPDSRITTPNGTGLRMCMQGHKAEPYQVYKLNHYHCNIFSWLLTLDECVYRGRSPICSKDFYLLKFEVENDVVTGLRWTHDSSIRDSCFSRKQ